MSWLRDLDEDALPPTRKDPRIMQTAITPVGARLVDSLPFSNGGSPMQAKALKDQGVDGLIGYLGAMNADRLKYVLDAGLAFMPVTFAGAYANGAADEVVQLQRLGIPSGTTVWLDLEGAATLRENPQALAGKINAWAGAIKGAGYEPGLYVGAPQPFTSEELYQLAVVRYWKAGSRIVDRNGRLAEPGCGWCMYQLLPQHTWKGTGVFVDVDFAQQDYRGRLPSWALA